MQHHLAEYNIARLRRPLDDEENAEFVAALGPVNEIAESTPGFVWRLTAADGAASSYVRLPEIDDPLTIINLSVWTDLESLRHYTARSGHGAYLRRRRDWFDRLDDYSVVCWWVSVGDRPEPAEGHRRLLHLRTHGPSETGWPMTQPRPAPSAAGSGPP